VPVRLLDVADHAQVSQATASRVLNGKDGVSQRKREAVLSAAEELGYTRTRPTARRVLGILIPELENPVFAEYAQRLGTALAQGGDTPVICSQTANGVSEDEWLEVLLQYELAGVIVVSGMHADTHADPERYRRLRELRIPVVLVNGHVEGLDAVFLADDDHAAMGLAVSHLTSLGHSRIGLAVGPERYVPVIRKVAGFQDALEGKADGLVAHSFFTIEGGRAATSRLLEEGATAVICGSDTMALGAYQACRSLRLEIPGDVSIIGYGDYALAAFTGPPLTSVRQSIPAICDAAVQALLDELDGRPAARQEYLFQPELTVRASSGPAPASVPRPARSR
jgi:LacI family repressor for deo operon, udp, cdd, tsx, nupC, and nupG